MHAIADAIRDVTAAIQRTIDDGSRSRAIDADDLVEALLAIADRIDPPVSGEFACPGCGESDSDRLIWQDDETVRCDACGNVFDPSAR
jgi:hypothetical protein